MNNFTFVLLSSLMFTASAASLRPSVSALSAGIGETHWLTRPEGTIAYEDTGGDGPLVVCVPGMGDFRGQYRFLAPALFAAGYRVVATDLRGLGQSSAGWSDYSAAAVGADIVALVDELQAKKVFVIGNSFAAAAAVWAAAERPQLVQGIVLIGPFVRDLPVSFFQRMILAVAFTGPWANASWSMYYQSLYPSAPPADLPTYRQAQVDNLAEFGRMAALRGMLDGKKAPCEKRIPEVKAKALVIMGDKDPDFKDPKAEASLVAERLHGTVLMVEGAGHYPHTEMTAKVAPGVLSFLAGQ